jgi:proteasome lid subunit RPN8/RPN11
VIDIAVMYTACLDSTPMEACGVILHDGRVLHITNVATRPGIFIMDEAELIAVYEEHGEIDGVWHTHPSGDENPSQADLDAHPPGKMMFIATPSKVVYHGRPGQATSDCVSEGSGELGEEASLHAITGGC